MSRRDKDGRHDLSWLNRATCAERCGAVAVLFAPMRSQEGVRERAESFYTDGVKHRTNALRACWILHCLSFWVRIRQRERRRSPLHAKARPAACGAWPWSRCGWEERRAQQACRIAAAAHATTVWRRHGGHGRRPCPQACCPRRAVPGAMPTYLCSAAAAA